MKNIHAVIFDKTGTLTEGKFGVTDVISFKKDDFSGEEILKYAASVEKESEHPVAQGYLNPSRKPIPSRISIPALVKVFRPWWEIMK